MLFNYPMPHQYIEMVSAMFLRQQVNSDDALALWKTHLKTHFKNARQRLSHIAKVAAKKSVSGKRKESFEEECNQQLKRKQHSTCLILWHSMLMERMTDPWLCL